MKRMRFGSSVVFFLLSFVVITTCESACNSEAQEKFTLDGITVSSPDPDQIIYVNDEIEFEIIPYISGPGAISDLSIEWSGDTGDDPDLDLEDWTIKPTYASSGTKTLKMIVSGVDWPGEPGCEITHEITIHVVDVAFNKDPVEVGIGDDRTSETQEYLLPDIMGPPSMPHRLSATITPKAGAGNITFESSLETRATVVEVSRTDIGDTTLVVLEVTGIEETPVGSPGGDTDIRALFDGDSRETTKVIVIKPKTRVHVIGDPILRNYTKPTPDGLETMLMSEVKSIVTITIKDQFGNTLHSIYNGTDVVKEKFENITTSNGASMADEWTEIDKPENIFYNGEKLDELLFEVGESVGSELSEQYITAWENFEYQYFGKLNMFAVWGVGHVPTAQGDMELKVDGHEVTPTIRRTQNSLGNVDYPDVPFSVEEEVLE